MRLGERTRQVNCKASLRRLHYLWFNQLDFITSAGECQPIRLMGHITLLHSDKKRFCVPDSSGFLQLDGSERFQFGICRMVFYKILGIPISCPIARMLPRSHRWWAWLQSPSKAVSFTMNNAISNPSKGKTTTSLTHCNEGRYESTFSFPDHLRGKLWDASRGAVKHSTQTPC